MSIFHDIYKIFQNSMTFPGFPGVLSFFQVEWEPCVLSMRIPGSQEKGEECSAVSPQA